MRVIRSGQSVKLSGERKKNFIKSKKRVQLSAIWLIHPVNNEKKSLFKKRFFHTVRHDDSHSHDYQPKNGRPRSKN